MSSNPTSDDAKHPAPDADAPRANGTTPDHPGAANYGIPSGAAESGEQPIGLDKPGTDDSQTQVLGGAPYPAGAGGANDATKVIDGRGGKPGPATADDATQVIGAAGVDPQTAEWWHAGQATEPATEVIDQRTQAISGQGPAGDAGPSGSAPSAPTPPRCSAAPVHTGPRCSIPVRRRPMRPVPPRSRADRRSRPSLPRRRRTPVAGRVVRWARVERSGRS